MIRFLYYITVSILIILSGCGGQISESGLPSPRQNLPLSNQILEYIYYLCEKPGYGETDPFCLTHNLRNIRQIIQPYLYKISPYSSKDNICRTINDIIRNDLKMSHFRLKNKQITDNSWGSKFAANNSSQSFIKNYYVKLKITDFSQNFNKIELRRGLNHAYYHQKGIIIDLRDNPGGDLQNVKEFLSYFFSSNVLISHMISRRHEPFLNSLNQWIGNYSLTNMNNLINTIQSNWNLNSEVWENFLFVEGALIQEKIAILINANSASGAELVSLALKDHFPNRVKIIGEKSAGALLVSSFIDIPYLGLTLCYPFKEIIGIHGTRVEGVGIKPDERCYSENQCMALAKAWVTR